MFGVYTASRRAYVKASDTAFVDAMDFANATTPLRALRRSPIGSMWICLIIRSLLHMAPLFTSVQYHHRLHVYFKCVLVVSNATQWRACAAIKYHLQYV